MNKDTQQLEVINHEKGPAVVLAGAGSGKTRTLIERVERLSKITSPKRIVMLTFTNAAADEMKERAINTNDACRDIIASTYHKYCGMILRKYGSIIGIKPDFEVLTGMKYTTFIEYIKSQDDTYEELDGFPSASRLNTIFSALSNHVATLPELISGTKYDMYEHEILYLYKEVKREGFERQKLSFDDMLFYMNQLLKDKDMCEQIANTFDYLLVDEFQDTNELQLEMLVRLGKYNNNIVVVGDESQSIYRFRGARVENIANFIKAFPTCKKFHLSTNYRSTQEILDAVNSVMNRNVLSWDYTNMVSNDKHGNKPHLIQVQNEYALAKFIIHQINSGIPIKDMAVLERSSFSSFILENELLKADIPFVKMGGLKFTEYVCVDEILSFLAVVINKKDTFSWFNVLKLIPGVGQKTATSIAEECALPNFLDKYKKRKFFDNLSELIDMLNHFRTISDLKVLLPEVIDYYVELRKYKITLIKNNSAKFDAQSKLDRDCEIIQILKDMSNKYTRVSDFLDDIALDSVKTGDEKRDHLVISTIHSAKGLEWKYVFLIDCIEGKLNYQDEEDLRCLYVAMTRAEQELIILIPQVMNYNGAPMNTKPSYFLSNSLSYFNRSVR